ncbi:MAG: SBBP repeat-containing protein [Acidobacteria bacterium]|nr:SBBP repeat-containing protein [Acidobacteriota bacterium]
MRILPSLLAVLALSTASAFAGRPDPRQALAQIPAWFEPAPGGAGYLSRSASLALAVDAGGATFSSSASSVRLSFPGSRPAALLQGQQPQLAATDYLIGNNRAAWRTNVPHFQQVAASSIYPGIDVVYYAAGKLIEFDFVVSPGSNPSHIRMQFSGAAPALQPDGSLLLSGGLRQHAPVSYQMRGSSRVPVESRYVVEHGQVRLALGRYDSSLPLVIDPVISWAGYFGGDQFESIFGAAIASDGSYWITGASRSVIPIVSGTDPYSWERNGTTVATIITEPITASATSITVASYSGFPTETPFNIRIDDETLTVTDGAGTTAWTVVRAIDNSVAVAHAKSSAVYNFQVSTTVKDAYIARIVPDGANWKLAYFTYIGGSADDEGTAITVSGKYIAITGTTASLDFPVTANAFQSKKDEDIDAFLLLYDPTVLGKGSLIFSSFFGGEKADYAQAIAAGPNNRIAITGYTTSGFLQNVISGMALQPANRGGTEAFLLVAQPLKSFPESFLYATYYGGSSTDIANSVAFTSKGYVAFAGTTMSEDIPVSDNANQSWASSVGDGFLVLIQPDLTVFDSFIYGGYFGGSDLDAIQAITVDPQDRIWAAGYTFSDDLPVSPGAYAISRRGSSDAFVARFDLTKPGMAFIDYLTYLGGKGGDVPYAIAYHPASGTATVAGYTSSPDFPFVNIQGATAPPINITEFFASRLDPSKSAQNQLVWSAILGGVGTDVATAVALDPAGNAFIAGYSNSSNLNIGNAPAKPSKAGGVSGLFYLLTQ